VIRQIVQRLVDGSGSFIHLLKPAEWRQNMYPFIAFFLIMFWTVVLLYGLWRDPSIRSRLLRLLAVFFLWGMVPPSSGSTIVELIHHIGGAYPAWIVIILAFDSTAKTPKIL
jgi:hypothetical protein